MFNLQEFLIISYHLLQESPVCSLEDDFNTGSGILDWKNKENVNMVYLKIVLQIKVQSLNCKNKLKNLKLYSLFYLFV